MEPKEIISSGILELYATGTASLQEIDLVQSFLVTFPEVADELSKIEGDLETYAMLFAVEPDVDIKEKIFEKINYENKNLNIAGVNGNVNNSSAKIVSFPSYLKFVSAAAVLLLVSSVALNVVQYNKNNDINKILIKSDAELAVLKQDNSELSTDMGVVQNKYSKPVSLHGLEASPNATAKIFYIENTGEVYIDPSNLPVAPEGKQYQLWGIVNGKPVDAGMILTSKKGDKYRIQKMKTFGKAEAFAVTLETGKGNQSPQGPMYVMGKM